MSLADVTTPDAEGRLEVPAGWNQGRGAYGGLVIGSLVRAIESSVSDRARSDAQRRGETIESSVSDRARSDAQRRGETIQQHVGDAARSVRSVTAEIVAPLEVGPAAIEVDLLRSGKSVSFVRATLRHGGEVRAHAVGIVAAAKPTTLAWQDLVAPEAPPWQTVTPLPWRPPLPEFAQQFEYRVIEGLPMSGGAPRTLGYARAKDPGAPRDAAYLAALIDVWWPAALTRLTAMRPMMTIAYTLDIVGSLAGEDPEAPLLYRGVVPVAAEGYCLEQRELWTASGRLIAINHQTLAVL